MELKEKLKRLVSHYVGSEENHEYAFICDVETQEVLAVIKKNAGVSPQALAKSFSECPLTKVVVVETVNGVDAVYRDGAISKID